MTAGFGADAKQDGRGTRVRYCLCRRDEAREASVASEVLEGIGDRMP